jgi:hypothetical protein
MRAERKKIARWAILAKEPDCRADIALRNDPVDHFSEGAGLQRRQFRHPDETGRQYFEKKHNILKK